MEYKKVSEIIKELNIYSSLMYKIINEILIDELVENKKYINNVLYFDEEGIEKIKKHLEIIRPKKTTDKIQNDNKHNKLDKIQNDDKLDIIINLLSEILMEVKQMNKSTKPKIKQEKRQDQKIYTTTQIAEELNLNVRAVSRLIKNNRLKATKIKNRYSISHDDYMEYLKQENK